MAKFFSSLHAGFLSLIYIIYPG